MSNSISIDVSEVEDLARDLAVAARAPDADVKAAVKRGAVNVKKDARALASGIGHAPAYPYSIGFDLEDNGFAARIGPDKDRRQGALGNILEFGTSKNGPIPHLNPAMDAEEPRFVRALQAAAVKALRW